MKFGFYVFISNNAFFGLSEKENQMERLNWNSSTDAHSQGTAVLHEVARLCQSSLALDIVVSDDSTRFSTKTTETNPDGIQNATAKLLDEDVLLIRLELIRADRISRIEAGTYFEHLSNLGPRVNLVPPEKTDKETSSLWVELKVKPTPFTPIRENAFLDELAALQAMAKGLQSDLARSDGDKALANKYKDFEDKLEPVMPLRTDLLKTETGLVAWAEEVRSFLSGGNSVAIESPHSVELDYALAVIAAGQMENGSSLGRCVVPAVDAKAIVQLARAAPGALALSAVGIRMSTSLFDLSNETENLLASLAGSGNPAIFTGTQQQLQSVFSGGQGGAGDPLFPIVCHMPEIDFEGLARFMIINAARPAGGVSTRAESELTERIVRSLEEYGESERKRLVQTIARKAVNDWAGGAKSNSTSDTVYVKALRGRSETFAGLSDKPRVKRAPNVQVRFTRVLRDPGLPAYFKTRLLCQDRAIEEQCEILATEALARPGHQLIRSCSVGTSGTGKSEFCVLLARRLGIPYVNIDAASMPDHHMAVTQLLGSGRGFVGSYQAGRLEQIAKHHTGAVVEVSDLDHAAPDVRATLPEIFLQALETGEAQAANGAMFSCANIIFIFTMNLLAGMDEKVQTSIGFQQNPSRAQVTREAVTEMKQMLSNAFLGRIGTPVFYESLTGDALAQILERSMKEALCTAIRRLSLEVGAVRLAEGIGPTVLRSLQANLSSFGARALLEHGRRLAAMALNEWVSNDPDGLATELVLDSGESGKLVIREGNSV